MPDAIEVINSISSQHFKITENANAAGQKMNDIDAIFSVQVAAYKTAQSAFSVAGLLEKRDELLHAIDLMGDGLKKHFVYEEKALPLVFGELLMKEIQHDHSEILGRIESARTILTSLDKLSHEELLAKRLDLLESVNVLRSTVVNHAKYEEQVLDMTKKVFEVAKARPD